MATNAPARCSPDGRLARDSAILCGPLAAAAVERARLSLLWYFIYGNPRKNAVYFKGEANSQKNVSLWINQACARGAVMRRRTHTHISTDKIQTRPLIYLKLIAKSYYRAMIGRFWLAPVEALLPGLFNSGPQTRYCCSSSSWWLMREDGVVSVM